MAEQYDLSDANEERAHDLAEVFSEIAWDMHEDDDEDIKDIVYAMVLVISIIMTHKQASDARKH